MSRLFTTVVCVVLLLVVYPLSAISAVELLPPTISQAAVENGAKIVDDVRPMGHRKEITVFAVSKDGRYALTGDQDQNDFLWDLKTGTLLRKIGTPDPVRIWVVQADFSPDASTLLWARYCKHMPVLWDVSSGKRLGVLSSKEQGHGSEIVSLAFSGDGHYVATGDMLGTVVIWNMQDRSVVRRIKAHAGKVSHLTFIPGGNELASAGVDGAVLLWSVESAEPLAALMKPSGTGISALTVSGNGSVLYAALDDMTVKEWSVPTRNLRGTLSFENRQIISIAVSPAGNVMALANEDGSLLLWNIRESRVAWKNELENSALLARFSPDGTSLFTSGGDNWIREWAVSSGRLIRKFAGAGDKIM